MRVLLTGANGQLGTALRQLVPPDVELFASDRAQLDVLDAARVDESVRRYRPDVVINAAANTAATWRIRAALAVEVNSSRHARWPRQRPD